MDKNKQSGVTFIELIITMGIIIIISGIAIYALNPSRQFAQARNTQRAADINTIAIAVQQRIADNRGTWSTTCSTTVIVLPSATTTIGTDAPNLNLNVCLVPTYVPSVRIDPTTNPGYSATNTGYAIFRDALTSRITVAAPLAELGEYISVTR